MGKALALAVTGFIVISIFHQQNRSSSELETRRQVSNSQYETLARDAAISGINIARQYLSDYWASSSWTPSSRTSKTITAGLGQASYTVNVSMNGTKASVLSTGTIGNASGAQTAYSIRSEYVREAEVPDFMKEAIVQDGNFLLENDFLLDSEDSSNANVHTNGNIQIKSGTASIHGFGYHKGDAQTDNGQALTDIFTPYSNPDGKPVTQKVSEITIPSFKAEDHSGIATERYYSDLKLGGTVTLGTKDNPKIIYVEGSVTTTSDVVFSGYGVFVITGSVQVYHNVTQTGTTENNVGFYANGSIYVENGGLSLDGQWLANGNAKMQVNTHFTGTVTLKGNMEVLGPMHMTYRPASSALTQDFWSTANFSMNLLSVYEE